MNWLLIIVILVLALCTLNGYRKGLLRMLYSALAWIIAFAFVSWATPGINTYLKENTVVYQKVVQYCEQGIREKVQEQAEKQFQQAMEDGQQDGQQNGEPAKLFEDMGIKLPDRIASDIAQRAAGVTDNVLDTGGAYNILAEELADFILNGISFFIAMAIATIVLHLISQIFRIVSRIPVLRGVNRYFGMVIGAVYGILIVWIGFYMIAICGSSEIGAQLLSYIYENTFLTYLYENNLIIFIIQLIF